MSSRLPLALTRVATAAEMRAIDAQAIAQWGISGAVLMENAGRAAADVAQGLLEARARAAGSPRRDRLSAGATHLDALILVGPGNNGGDGLVVGRTLAHRGYTVEAVFAGHLEPLQRFSDETFLNHLLWQRQGRDIAELTDVDALAPLEEALGRSTLVVDALFGTGLSRPLDPLAQAIVARVAAERARRELDVLALDVPSGLDADTGEVLGACVTATHTACFAALKPGLTRARGPEDAGEVSVHEIGLPEELLEDLPRA